MSSASYKKLLQYAQMGGNVQNIGTVIGSLKDRDIKAHLALLRESHPELWKTWGRKYKPEEDDDPTAGLHDEPEEDDPTAGLTDVEEPEEKPAPPPKKQQHKESTKGLEKLMEGQPKLPMGIQINGKNYPETFQLRKPDGTTIPLEVFSKSPEWGFYLRVPVPTDMRTLTLGGQEVKLDLLSLRRDPDGTTLVGTKRYSNFKLIAAIELEE